MIGWAEVYLSVQFGLQSSKFNVSFEASGIFPFNKNVFSAVNFTQFAVTDRTTEGASNFKQKNQLF